MKKTIITPILALAIVLTLAGCNGQTTKTDNQPKTPFELDVTYEPTEGIVTVSDDGETSIDPDKLEVELVSVDKGELSDEEKAGLIYMWEEERLAYEVYINLFKVYRDDERTFLNIARSEDTHQAAMQRLLERYDLLSEEMFRIEGEYNNETLQGLYDELLAQGSTDIVEGLKVGALVEEVDILDLQERIAQTDKADIKLVYENLMKGSRNHLRAFVRRLAANGVTYEPQKMSQEEYDAIINSGKETGGAGNGGQGGKNGIQGGK